MMKIAILGSGSIVPDFLEAVSDIPELEPAVILGREKSREKLERLAQKYSIRRISYDYDELLVDPQVDAVYVAMPNNLHYEYAKRALEHGKHVIQEKPFTSTLAEAQELVALAKERHRVIFEAISNQYLPNYQKTKELIGTLGDIRLVQINFSQYSSRYDRFRAGIVLPVFDPKQSGGALMDLNVYNIYFVTGLFGKPKEVHYYANIQKGIDTSGVLVMIYPAFLCVCTGAKDCRSPFSITIQGEQGCITSSEATNQYAGFCLAVNGEEPQEYALNEGRHRMYYEMRTFADMVLAGDFEQAWARNEHTLMVMEILETARRQAGIEFS
ncbi:MAG: Gfo/Idh/MocA family oxidoreductase [Clostridiales bacterium]|nr:Gfo/Idh/MocA family oxidoreductase [Clostridiales bacterium]